MLFIYFDPSYGIDIEKELPKYQEAVKDVCQYTEFIPHPEVDMTPGEYLYSDSMYHPYDTIWPIYDDNDEKRNWREFRYLHKLESGELLWNEEEAAYYEQYWGPTDRVLASEYNRPFPYKWAFHSHSSLWQHTSEYNNTYKAWDYTRGEGVTALVSDPHSFWTQHPDLVTKWHPGVQTDGNDGSTLTPCFNSDSYYNWWTARYHGTNCAGALAAGIQQTIETELTNLSSVGVAPSTLLIGKNPNSYNLASCVGLIYNHPEYNIKVISVSYGIYWVDPPNNTYLDIFQDLIDLGVTIVKSRGYDGNTHTSPRFGYLEGLIVVGDYMPDYRVKKKFTSDAYNTNPYYYQVEINAPGWEIWVPSIYHTYESQFQQIGYGLAMGTNSSIATPQVAGVAALIISKYPWMTPAQVERQIKLGAHHLDDMIAASASFVPNTPPSFFGAGCLNAYSSLFLHGDFQRNFIFSNEANNTALIGKEFSLTSSSMRVDNGTLRIEKDAHVRFNNSTLTLGDNVTVIFESGSKLELVSNANLVVGNNVSFRTENDESCQGLLINGDALNPSIVFNNTIFTGVPVAINNTEVTYSGCTFTKSNVTHNNMPLSVDQCGFFFSGLQVIETVPDTEDLCMIQNSEFTHSAIAGIQVTGYPTVKIRSNTITYNYRGIELYEC